ncbi:aminotransferase class I/II-fold pyridoxal phosphate-dependent enzyme [Sediminispirochaeta smaragdinae]|uniref:Aminotransferase class I and II n=1 Tax=Sediminispirochaeta smaragdinae (strain DSM 11293 / JCM 15392 / SEBR 4228) TaxID=573413 RepID=E1RCS6_SEDSS|nr:aminotransferase class I/II-fold pyridoxal phosphate-dependent enzyme [Sediminispirochaeta smaragdinae]ADK80156.1 aminotransferase class I and II [Sediminispirochaeta smaragdinae DSM 11293]
MNTIAHELNDRLEGSTAYRLLSDFGKRFYFPKGIVAQSAEAKQKAHRFNATVGMATKGPVPMYLKGIKDLVPGIEEQEIFPYAPTPGVPELRKLWRSEMDRKNPSLKGKNTSLPLVTSGLTHGISVVSDLFLDEGDSIVVPDMFWGNYRLIFEGRNKAKILSFPFFNDEGGLHVSALKDTLESVEGDTVALILNFPNNPTGYSPTEREADQIVAVLKSLADEGKKVLCITDDAYFGLFYEKGTCTESLFARLADLHENIFAVKVDGATKEEFAWGFRIGFITYAGHGMSGDQYEALEKKTMGAIRSSISNSSKIAQSLLLRGMKEPGYLDQKQEAFSILEARYRKVRELVGRFPSDAPLQPLPFNSGYFMTFVYKGNSEKLRLHLLDKYGVGTISIQEKYLRIAYSSVEIENLEELYQTILKAAGEVL